MKQTPAQKFLRKMRAEPKRYRVFDQSSPEVVAMLEVIEVADACARSELLRFPGVVEDKLNALPGGDNG